MLLSLTSLLNAIHFVVEARERLLVDSSNGFVTAIAFVSGVVVDGERTLRAEELGHASVVLVRNFLAVKGCLHFVHVLNDAWRGNLRAGQRHAIRCVHNEALVLSVFIHDT